MGVGGLAQSQNRPINSSLSPAGSQARLLHSSPQQRPAPRAPGQPLSAQPWHQPGGWGVWRKEGQLSTVAIGRGSTWSLPMLSNLRKMILPP